MKSNSYISYLFEIAWILPSIAIPAAMLVAIALTAFAMGVRVPSDAGQVDPRALDHTPPFDQPGLRELAPGHYEAVLTAQTFLFTPNKIRVPQGAEVTFVLSSKDVIHGFKIENTPINMMVVPGQVARLTTTFKHPGEYLFICHEYCGAGHHVMAGMLVVEPPTIAQQ